MLISVINFEIKFKKLYGKLVFCYLRLWFMIIKFKDFI